MFDELSVAENIYMGRQPMKKGVIDWATMNSQAQVIPTRSAPVQIRTCWSRASARPSATSSKFRARCRRKPRW